MEACSSVGLKNGHVHTAKLVISLLEAKVGVKLKLRLSQS